MQSTSKLKQQQHFPSHRENKQDYDHMQPVPEPQAMEQLPVVSVENQDGH